MDKFGLWRRAIEDPGLDAHEKAVAFVLIWHLNATTRRCDPSYATLQRETALSRSAVYRAVQGLQDKGLLRVIPRPGSPAGYDFDPPPGSSCSLLCSGVPQTPLPVSGGHGFASPFSDDLPSLETAKAEANRLQSPVSRVVRRKTAS